MTHTSSIMNSVNVLLNSTDKQLGMDLWERSVSWSPVPLDRDGPPSRRGAGTRSTVCDFCESRIRLQHACTSVQSFRQ